MKISWSSPVEDTTKIDTSFDIIDAKVEPKTGIVTFTAPRTFLQPTPYHVPIMVLTIK
jgi:hypothetical protein